MELADFLFGNSFSEFPQSPLPDLQKDLNGTDEQKIQLEILCDENSDELPVDFECRHVDSDENLAIEVEIVTDLQKSEKSGIDENIWNCIHNDHDVNWNVGSKIQNDDLQTPFISLNTRVHCIDLSNMNNHLVLQESLDSINLLLSDLIHDNQDDLTLPAEESCSATDSDNILSAASLWNGSLFSHHDNMSKVKAHQESDPSNELTDQYLTLKYVQVPVTSKTVKAQLQCSPKKIAAKSGLPTENTGSSFYKTVVEWMFRKSQEHGETIRAISRLKCPECGRHFPRAASLRRHVGCVHLGLREHTCKTCGAEFGKKDNLQRHLLTHRENLPFACGVCDKRFARRETLFSHILDVHKVSNYHYKSPVENFMHIIAPVPGHQNLSEKLSSRFSKTKISRFQCTYCNSYFSTSTNLNNHVRFVHFNERKFKCELCDQLFTRKLYLREHVRKVHIHVNVPFCSLCKIGFVERGSLVRHKRITHRS